MDRPVAAHPSADQEVGRYNEHRRLNALAVLDRPRFWTGRGADGRRVSRDCSPGPMWHGSTFDRGASR